MQVVELAILMVAVAVMQVMEMAILMVDVAGDAGGGDDHPKFYCCRCWRWPS